MIMNCSLGKRYVHVKLKSCSNLAIGANGGSSSSSCLLVCGELFGQRFRSAQSSTASSASCLTTMHGSNDSNDGNATSTDNMMISVKNDYTSWKCIMNDNPITLLFTMRLVLSNSNCFQHHAS